MSANKIYVVKYNKRSTMQKQIMSTCFVPGLVFNTFQRVRATGQY